MRKKYLYTIGEALEAIKSEVGIDFLPDDIFHYASLGIVHLSYPYSNMYVDDYLVMNGCDDADIYFYTHFDVPSIINLRHRDETGQDLSRLSFWIPLCEGLFDHGNVNFILPTSICGEMVLRDDFSLVSQQVIVDMESLGFTYNSDGMLRSYQLCHPSGGLAEGDEKAWENEYANEHSKFMRQLIHEYIESNCLCFLGCQYMYFKEQHFNKNKVLIRRSELNFIIYFLKDIHQSKSRNLIGLAKDSDRSLHPKERNTLLKLIRVLALEAGVPISTPHAAEELIHAMGAKHGVSVPKGKGTLADKIEQMKELD